MIMDKPNKTCNGNKSKEEFLCSQREFIIFLNNNMCERDRRLLISYSVWRIP